MNLPFATETILARLRGLLHRTARRHVEYARRIAKQSPKRLVVEVPESEAGRLVAQMRKRMLTERIVFASLLAVIVSGWCVTSFTNRNSLIIVDGKPVVCVPTSSDAEQILLDIKNQSGLSAEKVQFRQEVVVARAPRSASPISRHKAMRIVERSVSPVVSQWAIIADGKPIAALPNEKMAAQVLEMAKLRFGSAVPNLAEEPQIKEDIKVDIAAVDPSIFCKSAEKATELIFTESKAAPKDAVYRVRSGDTADGIARGHSLSIRELWQLNPGVNLNRLNIGDTLNVRETAPPKAQLTVVVRDLSEREESTPPPTRRVSSPRMRSGKTIVLDQGAPGRRIVRVATIYENGRKVGSEVMDEEVLREPSPRVLAVGIKH